MTPSFADLVRSDVTFGCAFLPKRFPLKPSWYHYDMADPSKDDVPFAAYAAPRDHAKSTNKCVARPLRRAIVKGRPRYMIISQTARFAGDWLRKIAEEVMTNQRLHQIFGVRPSTPWRESEEINFTVNGESRTILARGVGCQVRGEHVSDITIDDPEDLESVRSETQRENLADWMAATLIGGMESDTTLNAIGTLIHQFCYLAKVVGNPRTNRPPKSGWHTKIYRALMSGTIEDSNPILLWPEKCPREFLLRQWYEMGPIRWNREYQNDPAPDEAVIFQEKWFVHRRWGASGHPPLDQMNLCMFLDPNGGEPNKEGGDFAAFAIVGVVKAQVGGSMSTFRAGDIYVLHVERGQWGFLEMLDRLYKAYLQYGVGCLFFEGNQFQAAVGIAFSQYCSERGKYPAVIKMNSITSKEMRARSVSNMCQQGRVWLPPESSQHWPDWASQEFFTFPVVDHDDLTDAVVGALRGVREYSEAWGDQNVGLPGEHTVVGTERVDISELTGKNEPQPDFVFNYDASKRIYVLQPNPLLGPVLPIAEARKAMFDPDDWSA